MKYQAQDPANTYEDLQFSSIKDAQPSADHADLGGQYNPQAESGEIIVKITLDQLINLCVDKEASDIHFREGGRVGLRVGRKIIFIEDIKSLSKAETEAMINAMIPSEEEKKRLEHDREIDFSYTHTNGISFRVNAFYQKGKLAGVMRMITKHIPTLEQLGVPAALTNFLNIRQGLVLVCGGAGSGKSTTIQAMLQYINENFVKHILTIENPIEYVFEDKKSIFTQREVGKDTLTESNALKSAFREDADVVMVSGIIDYETLDKVLDLVETGHLVIASMLTRDATQTVERMIDFYPHDMRWQALRRVADNMTAVLVQNLVDRRDGQGRVAIFELMLMNQSIHEIISRGNYVQLRSAIQSSASEGMITMDSYAYELADQGIVNQESIAEYLHPEEQ